jgi:hypothetical protein
MTVEEKPAGGGEVPKDALRSDVPHSARIYNYWLGGKDNFEIDRVVGEQVIEAEPDMVAIMRANRAFLGRAVTYLTRDVGVRQFLDVGTGLPSADNTHEVAQRIAPESRIVYVDNDPIVLAHARALLTSTPEGKTTYLDADAREPRKILHLAAETLDYSEPVAVMLLGTLGHIAEDGDAKAIIDALMEPLAPGSHVVISLNTTVIKPENMRRAAEAYNAAFGNPPIYLSSPERITALFSGFELVDPGVVSVTRWKPDPATAPDGQEPEEVDLFVGVARKS